MKYTTEGFQQSVLCSWGLDGNDAIILRYIVDFYQTRQMIHRVHNNRIYFWVYYKTIIDNLPILEIKNKRVIARRFDRYVKCGLMLFLDVRGRDEYMQDGQAKVRHGSYTYYAFMPDKLVQLVGDRDAEKY
jgi:hypothetical protein